MHVDVIMCHGHPRGANMAGWLNVPPTVVVLTYSFTHTHAHTHTYMPISLYIQLKNMIAALYSSRTDGTKEFKLEGVAFRWETTEKVYQADMCRVKAGITQRVPGLKYAHIVRDNWTRLNVLPAKIMQVITFSCATIRLMCGWGGWRANPANKVKTMQCALNGIAYALCDSCFSMYLV